ncbi:hypothetical protein KAU11_12370 [Candidatus Babeliales bacterium]|nr:hypothetical protein [Candidatus Babeliales bacterium]
MNKKEPNKSMIIHSGEGNKGTFEKYTGSTGKGFSKKIKEEQSNGDRWVKLYIKDDSQNAPPNNYIEVDADLKPTGDMRRIEPAYILSPPDTEEPEDDDE